MKFMKKTLPLGANSTKAQLQIQQMAFVLVALVILFSMIALIYFSISIARMRSNAEELFEKEAIETARALAGSPEFSFTAEQCSNCIDLDKVLMLKNKTSYQNYWNLDYLAVERVFPVPENNKVCDKVSYPDCARIFIIENKTARFGSTPVPTFITTVRWVPENGGYYKYELGKVYVSYKDEEE
jgi:hypothetical protein